MNEAKHKGGTKRRRRGEPTRKDLDAMLAAATSIKVPAGLKDVWQRWPLRKRAAFVARLRWRLAAPSDRPTTAFSAHVMPFDYGTPMAWEIVKRANKGLPPARWRMNIQPKSQGVIWDGRLWFWEERGYREGMLGPRGRVRALLTHAMWETAMGQPVPPRHAIRFRDGNPNNLDPANFELCSRAEIAAENLGRVEGVRRGERG